MGFDVNRGLAIIALIGWLVALGAIWILFRPQPQPFSGPEGIVFGKKVFYDSGEFVYITGTLTGDGLAYKNNTAMIACYHDRKECLFLSVDQIGPHQIGRLESPSVFPIVKWDTSEIMATDSYPIYSSHPVDCRKVTISIERKSESAVRVEEPINQTRAACKDADTKLYKYTIEDSLFWRRDGLSRAH